MEQALGRMLQPEERVHHRDRNPLNNSMENLELYPNQAAHIRKHARTYRDSTVKQCTRCLETKPRALFDAGPKRQNGDPNHTECKACRAAYYARRWKLGLTSQQRES